MQFAYSKIGDYQERLYAKFTHTAYVSSIIHKTTRPESPDPVHARGASGRITCFSPCESEVYRGSWIVQNQENGEGKWKTPDGKSAKGEHQVP